MQIINADSSHLLFATKVNFGLIYSRIQSATAFFFNAVILNFNKIGNFILHREQVNSHIIDKTLEIYSIKSLVFENEPIVT